MVKTLPSNAEGVGYIPGQGAKISHASRPKTQNMKQRQYCNKFNKDLKTKNKKHYFCFSSAKKKKKLRLREFSSEVVFKTEQD